MPANHDAIVIGLGALGSAALLSLARRGVRCIGLDRFAPPHDLGSSHGLSRIIRLSYYEHPHYVPLLLRAYILWDRLQRESADDIMRLHGGLYVGQPDDPFVAGSLASARKHDLEHELLSPADVARRFPQFKLREGEVGFFEGSAGTLFPERAIAATLRLARARGADVATNEPALGWSSDGSSVEVRTPTRTLHARTLILAAGPWLADLVPALRSTLTVTRQVVAWFAPRNAAPLHAPAMPVWAFSEPDGSAMYGIPLFDSASANPPGGRGFKIAHHKPGAPTHPDHVDRTVRPDDIAPLAEFLRERIPDACASDTPLATSVCLYTSTPDQHFLLDAHPNHANVIIASACSGHGFKLSPAMGEAAADLALHGASKLPIEFLRWRW